MDKNDPTVREIILKMYGMQLSITIKSLSMIMQNVLDDDGVDTLNGIELDIYYLLLDHGEVR